MLGVWGLKFSSCAVEPQQIEFFEKQVRPVLIENCVKCHGAEKQKGDLRLDSREALLTGGADGPVIVVVEPEKSMLIQVIRHEGKIKMPKESEKLSTEKIAALAEWIKMGAPWPTVAKGDQRGDKGEMHWAYQPIQKPPVPAVKNAKWLRTEIDLFILAQLEQKKLAPSPEADRATLIRRVTFGLTGLPPTPEEVTEFISDNSADAYDRLLDRLLASPRYGERWAQHWLDVVHYGETHGYDKDKRRPHAWPYRDYVIRAFNTDKPYTRFVQEQIAGDALFPDEPDGIVALGFLAAGPWDFVGHVELSESKSDGLIARYNDRDDMLTSAIQTFVSTTANCARCHDHKFDPIPQTDYYRLQAVFAGVDRANREYDPIATVTRQRVDLNTRRNELASRQATFRKRLSDLGGAELVAIEKRLEELEATKPGAEKPEFGYHSTIEIAPDATKWVQVDLGEPTALDRIVLVDCHDTFNNIGAGFGFPLRFKIEASDDPHFQQSVTLIADQTAAEYPNPRCQPQTFAARGVQARYVRVTATRLALRQNDYIFALAELIAYTPDGRNAAAGKPVTAQDSIESPARWAKKNLTDGYYYGVGSAQAADELTRLRHQQQTILDQILTADQRAERNELETALRATEQSLAALPPPLKVFAATSNFNAEGEFQPTGGKPRPIHLLHRGDVKQPRGLMTAGALSLFPDLEKHFQLTDSHTETPRRTALARWITDPRNPLTWRSIVNRVWHYHFGRGLVDTPNDFGKMGNTPTHPELLDWLATEFRDSGGSFKKLHKLILSSASYRQSSRDNRRFGKMDADNRYLWRANRQRLDAESVRDAILAISGQLDLTRGGPSVDHFAFEDDHSPRYLYADFDLNNPGARRRSIYRTIVRSVPDPFLESMDCPDANLLTPKRNTTTTALQALAMLNDRIIVRASEKLAERLRAGKPEIQNAEPQISFHPSHITHLYLLTLSRPPRPDELKLLTAYAAKHGLANTCRLMLNSNEFLFVD